MTFSLRLLCILLPAGCGAFSDPTPKLVPMPLVALDSVTFAKRSKAADAVVHGTIESIELAEEYTPGCGLFLRLRHDCPDLTYRLKLRYPNGKAIHFLFQIPWDGTMPLQVGMTATFFLHSRLFTQCTGAGAYLYCRQDRWMALNSPDDVVAP